MNSEKFRNLELQKIQYEFQENCNKILQEFLKNSWSRWLLLMFPLFTQSCLVVCSTKVPYKSDGQTNHPPHFQATTKCLLATGFTLCFPPFFRAMAAYRTIFVC